MTVRDPSAEVSARPETGSTLASAAAAAPGFSLRRVTNPHYRPPSSRPPALSPGVVSRMRALQQARALITRRGTRSSSDSFWEMAAGEHVANQDGYEASFTGTTESGATAVQTMRFDIAKQPWTASLGDVPVVSFARFTPIQGLRGVAVRGGAGPDSSAWTLLGGVPTPRPGNPTRRLGLGGVALEDWRFEESSLALTLLGFGRGRVPTRRAVAGDTLAGRGAALAFAAAAPLPLGDLNLSLGAQAHTLTGRRVLAAVQRIEWAFRAPQSFVTISEERASGHARVPNADRFTVAPRREDRWNAQTRFAGGRAELHAVGVLRDGGDPQLDARTFAFGGSRAWGAGWHAGTSITWDHRALDGLGERRLALHAGRVGRRGTALLGRLDHSSNDFGRRSTLFTGEASVPLRGGARLTLEPRLAWERSRFERAQATSSLGFELAGAARLTATLALGMARERRFTPALQEISLAVSFTPRARDHADLEVRRLSGDGVLGHEVTAAYDLEAARYETIGGWMSPRDSGRVFVHVVRGGNHTGMRDVLVSLDGREFRFTDADGVARFERVAPGVHVVAVEEGSLPEAHQVVNASRTIITIERGRRPDPVVFEVARPVRKRSF